MKKLSLYAVLLFVLAFCVTGCSDDDTYADQKERERDAISAFINRDVYIRMDGRDPIHIGRINPISEGTFADQGNTTDVEKNEYVLFAGTGIYMQIVRRGVGKPLAVDSSKQVACRFLEYSIMGDSLQLSNMNNYWEPNPDIMDVTNSGGTLLATFNTKAFRTGAMAMSYGTTVPSGWLIPLKYVGLGWQQGNQEIAQVRMIVPHSQGHNLATTMVVPYFYEITYQEVSN